MPFNFKSKPTNATIITFAIIELAIVGGECSEAQYAQQRTTPFIEILQWQATNWP
jgi:hypothetical protein